MFSLVLVATPLVGGHSHDHDKVKEEVSIGIHRFGKETVDAINADGSVSLDGTKVKGLVEVNGTLSSQNATVGKIDVNGHVNLKDTLIEEDALVNGAFTAERCHFRKTVSVSGLNPVLKNCKVGSVYVRKTISANIVQVLRLEDGTKIEGDVIFESKNGRVVMGPNCEIKGNIIGASAAEK